MHNNDDFITNNTTSINVDYSTNKLPLWAKKGLKINYSNDEDDQIEDSNRIKSSTNNLVHNRPNSISSTISSSTPVSSGSNRTRINLYNRSTDSDERNSVDDEQLNESPIDRLKKKAQQLSSTNIEIGTKLNGGDYNAEVDDLSSSLNNKKKNPLYISTENLKSYNDNFFTKSNLSKSSNNTNTSQLNSSLNNSRPNLNQKPSILLNNSSLSSTPKVQLNNQTNLINNSLNGSSLNCSVPTIKSTNTTASATSTINRSSVVSKRREELAKALSEARAKLQNIELNRKSTGGLSTSMSVANIHRLPLNLPSSQQQQKDNSNPLLVSTLNQKLNNLSVSINNHQNYSSIENDAVRRSISLSDLSHNQMLANRSLTIRQQAQQQIRNKLNSNSNNVYYPLRNFKKTPDNQQTQQFESSQGLWRDNSDRNQHSQPQIQQQDFSNHHERHLNGLNSTLNTSQNSINNFHHLQNISSTSITPTHKPIRVRMSRSSSMASINKSDTLIRRELDGYNKSQGLWNSPSSLSINTLKSNSSTQNNFNKFNNHHNKLSNHHPRKSCSDDESSSDENDLYHRISHQRPSTPPKPNIRQLRRSSTTSNNLFVSNNSNNLINNASLNSTNLTLQNNSTVSSTIKSTHKANRKSWSNNFELRPAKSEYNLNSMGQETVNSPSSGFWSDLNHSNGQSNGSNNTMANGNLKRTSSKQNAIGFENSDFLANINPATVPLTTELFQHVIDELNYLGTFAKKLHYRAQAEENNKLCILLKEGVSKAYVNLTTIVPFSSNNVLPATKSLNNSINKELSNNSFNHHHHNLNHNLNHNLTNKNGSQHHDSSNTDHDTEEDNLSSPVLNNNLNVGHVSLTSDSASSSLPQESLAMNLLQHYSERLLSMVEGQIRSKDK